MSAAAKGIALPARSYYAATANPPPASARLDGDLATDVVVIGAGATGLSAALHAAQRGYKVAVLEAGTVGLGASGRNGGLLIPGLRKGALELAAVLGREPARRVFQLADTARELVVDLIRAHAIACDLKETGHLLVAHKRTFVAEMAREVDALRGVMGYGSAHMLDRTALEAELGSHRFHGALLDTRGGHYHPLNYVLGLAHAAIGAGATLHENTRALRMQAGNGLDGVTVETATGTVRARHGVLAADAFIEGLEPGVARHAMPIASYLLATEPLREDARALIAHDRAVNDTRFVVNYFRLSADGRLVFGGGERVSRTPPADVAAFVRRYAIKVFPRLVHHRIAYSWGGLVAVTRSRLPHFGRRGDLFFAHGYSGQGALLATLGGQLIAEALAGTAERFDLFARIDHRAFPGGPLLRGPLHAAGMLWYGLRDRI